MHLFLHHGRTCSYLEPGKLITGLLDEFQKIVLSIVSKIIIPVLPFFIGLTFCGLAYEGSITKQLPVFLKVIVIVLIGHFIWMTLLYVLAGIYSHENPWEVVRNYGPAYLTAVGTMSSAATLAVALQCAGKANRFVKIWCSLAFLFLQISTSADQFWQKYSSVWQSPKCCMAPFQLRELWFCSVCFSESLLWEPWCSRWYCYGLSWYHHRCPWIQWNRNCSDAYHLCSSGQLRNSLQCNRDGALTLILTAMPKTQYQRTTSWYDRPLNESPINSIS